MYPCEEKKDGCRELLTLPRITLILDLVTHCCVCLVFVNGMGGGRVGMGFVFYLLDMVWRHFSV